jgi:putative peptidoglycan lipid II flippase
MAMIRPVALVSAGTLGSRLSGFTRDVLIAALLGAGSIADAFLIAFQLINVARRLLSEGALNAVLVPAYLRIQTTMGAATAHAFAGRALGTLGISVLALALLLGVVAPYALTLMAPGFSGHPAFQLGVDALRFMLPYLAFAGPVAVMAAALNAHDRVALTSFSPVLFNLMMITAVAALLLTGWDERSSALALAATVGVAGCLQLAFLGLSGTRYTTPVRVSFDDDIRTLLRRALPGMIAQSGPQLLLVAGAISASASPAAVSWIYFASRLIELPLGLVGAATGAVLVPKLSRATSDAMEKAATSSTALQLAFGLALPASVGLGLLATHVVQLLFEHGAFTADDTRATALALTILATALPALVLAKPLSAIFLSREQMRQPLLATLAGIGITLVASEMAHPHYGYAAVTGAISLGAWLITIWLAIALARNNELPIDTAAIRSLALIVLATAVMEVTMASAQRVIGPGDDTLSRATTLAALIALGMIVYVACLRLFGVVRFRAIRRAF